MARTMNGSRAAGPLSPDLRWFLCVALLAIAPTLTGSSYMLNVGSLALAFAVLATSLNLVFGFTGLLSFAQVGFWGVGAYVAAIATADYGVSPWLAFLMGGVFTGVLAILVGIPALRVSRASFVIVSLSFTLLATLLSRSWIDVTRGPLGIPGLPAPSIALGDRVLLDGHEPLAFYCIMLGFAVLALGFMFALVRSSIGRILLATNQNEALARSQGINVKHYQLLAFSVAAAFSGMTGGLYIFHLGIVDPSIFDTYYSEMLLIIVILGGAGNFWTVIVAAFVLTAVPELLRFDPELRLVMFGAVLVTAALVLPDGFGGYLRDANLKRWRKEVRP
ncbi:MAG: branched-chain amino acid ABC transporter permease [Roseovarius sp.]